MTADYLRPGYHVAARRNWINDPNGLVFVDGTYHVYFQHNPLGNDWDNMSWGHMSSPDLVHWTEHPIALHFDEYEVIFSGSIVVDRDNTSGLGDGSAPLVAVYTSVAPSGRQAQSLASSTDGGFTWIRFSGNPVLDRGSEYFRDPKVSRYTNGGGAPYWLMTVVEAAERTVLFYRSDDLKCWTLLSSFNAPNRTWNRDIQFWECPDLVHVHSRDASASAWVLIISVNPGAPNGGSGTMYFVGEFDGIGFTASHTEPRWLDRGSDYYAATSFAGLPRGRTMTVAWMNNWHYAKSVPTDPWRGALTLPRELTVERQAGSTHGPESVDLRQHLPHELDELVIDTVDVTATPFELSDRRRFTSPGRYRLRVVIDVMSASRIDGEFFLRGSAPSCASIRLSYDVSEHVLILERRDIGPNRFHEMFPTVDTAVVPLDGGRLDLAIWIDSSSIEVHTADGATWMSQLVVPDREATAWTLAATGGSASVSRLELSALRAPFLSGGSIARTAQ